MFIFDAKIKMNDCDLRVDQDLGFGLNHHDGRKEIWSQSEGNLISLIFIMCGHSLSYMCSSNITRDPSIGV